MGSKGSSSPQTTTTSSSPPPQVLAEYQGLVNRATNVANQPYQAYQGEQVAPLSYQTQAGLGGINQYANAAQPGYQAALNATVNAATPVSPMAYSGAALGQFMNPYTQSVVNATQNQFNNQNMQQAQALNSNAIGAGAYGGDRAGVAQGILANQQQTAQAPIIAGLNQANFTNAQNEFNTQQQTGLQAQEYNAGQLGAMANQYGALTGQAQQAGLQGAQAQIQSGMIPQQLQQQIDTAMQNNYLQQQAYPFQTTGWLGNIIEGTGSASGGTGTQSSPGPSTTSQALGGITSGLGILGSLFSLSDERAKDDIRPIGKTFDGQTIYRFRFKGDPRTQIGLLAHETERKHPGAVGHFASGLKGVDYDEATDSAADRGRFTYGGMVRPGYDVGGVAPTFLGQNGAIGVYTPGFDPQTQQLGAFAGVNEALAGAESAGQKNPYTGIDFDQIQAISSGQWMPPRTNAPTPNFTNPGSSPQTAGAEKSLAGLIDRPGIETPMPTTNTAPVASPSFASVTPQAQGHWMTSDGGQVTGGAANYGGTGLQAGMNFPSRQIWVPSTNPATGRARGGRTGDDSGPQFTTVQLNPTDRNKPIYTALDLSGGKKSDPVPTPAPAPEHPAVTIARHIARTRAPANSNTPPPVVKTGTGPDFVQPDHPSTMRYPSWPTPGPGGSGAGSGASVDADPPVVRFGAKIPPDFLPRRPGTALTPTEPDPMGWSVGENPTPPPRGLLPAPESPGDFFGRLPGRVLRAMPFGRAAGVGRQLLSPSPAETGELPPAYWPRDAVGAPSRPVTLNPRGNVIPLPNPNANDLGTWEGEGGAPAPTHNWGPWHQGGTPSGPIIAGPPAPDPIPRDLGGELNWGDEGPVNYAFGGRLARAAGGVLGQSGFAAALDQPPQGAMLSGPSSSGGSPQGGFATANQAAGFDQLYGAGRSGFAGGGDASTLAPYQGGEGFQSWVPTAANAMMGKGPPPAPSPQPQPQASASNQGQDLSKAIEKIGPMLKSKLSGPAPIAMPGADGSNVDLSGVSGTPDFSSLSDTTFDSGGTDFGGGFDNFFRGGRLARAAGGPPTPTDDQIDAAFGGPDPAPTPAASPAVAAIGAAAGPPQGNVGKGGYDPAAAIQKEFGDRAGYAATISTRESSMGKNWVGDDGSSFGDFQLHYGGVSQKYPHPGLGDAFTAATGMDARNNDPATRAAVAKFVAGYTAQHGWGDWSTAHDAPGSAGGAGGAGGASISGGAGADGLPGPMTVPAGYFHPRDYSDPNSSKRELFGAMMAAGFGMMAGTSPYAAVNIGQGGLAGVNYLQKQQEYDRDWMLNQAKIDQMSAQERRADADVGLRVNQWNLELAKYKGMMATNANVANILSGGSGSGGSGGGTSAAPTASPPPAETAGTPGPQGVAPSNLGDVGLGDQIIKAGIKPPVTAGAPSTPEFGGPGAATPKIAAGAPAPVVAPGPSETRPGPASSGSAQPNVPSPQATPVASPAPPASQAASPSGGTQPSGAQMPGENDPFWQGQSNPYKLIKAGQALMASPDPQQQVRGQELMRQGQEIFKTIGETGMAGGKPVPGALENKTLQTVQPEAAKALWAEQAKMSDQYDQRQVARQRLNDIQEIMQTLKTGAWATDKADLQAMLRSLGVDVPDSATWNAAAVQRFSKNAIANVFAQVKDVGGRPMVTEIKGLQEANANPDLSPEANAHIVAQGLGILDREDAHYQDYTTWHHQNPAAYDTSEFEKSWKKANPLEKFVNTQLKGFGYQGQYMPLDPTNRVDGQTYMTSKGPRVWNEGKGWSKPTAGATP